MRIDASEVNLFASALASKSRSSIDFVALGVSNDVLLAVALSIGVG
jgi:hypothetical protein